MGALLIGQADPRDAIQPWGRGTLHVLPSGQVPPNPSELLGSRSMASLLEHLIGQYDIVFIDTLPCLPHQATDTYTYYGYSAPPQTGARGAETLTDPATPDQRQTRASWSANRRSSLRPAHVKAVETKRIETGREAVPVSSTSEDSS